MTFEYAALILPSSTAPAGSIFERARRTHTMIGRLVLMAATLQLVVAHRQGVGISKNTYSVTKPACTLSFMLDFFNSSEASWSPDCACANGTFGCCKCGGLGRVIFAKVFNPTATSPVGFSLHSVNSSSRPFVTDLDKSMQDLEGIFTQKFGSFSEYDAFMDYIQGLYTSNLDPYIAKLHMGQDGLLAAALAILTPRAEALASRGPRVGQ